MSRRPETFSAGQVATMLGVGKSYVVTRINAGQLKAARLSRGTLGGHTFRISREQLVAFLLASSFPLGRLRRILNPSGAIILCQTPPAIQAALAPRHSTFQVGSLFDLGRALETQPCWAAIINLPEVGTSEAVRALRSYYLAADRPELIALAGDDGITTPSPIPFDVVLSAAGRPDAIARGVQLLWTNRA